MNKKSEKLKSVMLNSYRTDKEIYQMIAEGFDNKSHATSAKIVEGTIKAQFVHAIDAFVRLGRPIMLKGLFRTKFTSLGFNKKRGQAIRSKKKQLARFKRNNLLNKKRIARLKQKVLGAE